MKSKVLLRKRSKIPELYSQLCCGLSKRGLSQTEISRILQVTQPMVSRYLRKKPKISDEVKDLICEVDSSTRLHPSFVISTQCMPEDKALYIVTEEHLLSEEKSDMVKSILSSLEKLKDTDISEAIPKVKMNLAYRTAEAKGKEDVLSLPTGMICLHGRLDSFGDPEFGSSDHLAGILLGSGQDRCVMNIRYDKAMQKRIASSGHRSTEMHDDFICPEGSWDILVHKGSFGIEPATYIFGKDPEEVIRKLKRLMRRKR